jgi:hypothetical protein
MKRVFLIPLAFIFIVGTACSLGQSIQKTQPTVDIPSVEITVDIVPTEASIATDAETLLETAQAGIDEATQPVLPTLAELATEAVEPTAAEEPTAADLPTETAAPTDAPKATPQPPAATPAAGGTASGEYFVDKFTGDIQDYNLWVTVGNAKKHYGDLIGGVLRFELPAMDTSAYVSPKAYTYSDVYVEAKGEVMNGTNDTMVVACRISDAGWDEFRVNAKGMYAGSYELYRFDRSLVGKKIPYIQLTAMDRVNTMDIKTGNQANTIGLSCNGQQLRIFINGKEQLGMGKIVDKVLTSGAVGVGVIGYNQTASTFSFESLETKPPQ